MSAPMKKLTTLAVALLLIAGCGGNEAKKSTEEPTVTAPATSPTKSPTPTPVSTPTKKPMPVGLPKCSDTWVPGKVLPANYAGCKQADGSTYPAAGYKCTKRPGTFYALEVDGEDRYYAISGEPVREMTAADEAGSDTGEWAKTQASCFD